MSTVLALGFLLFGLHPLSAAPGGENASAGNRAPSGEGASQTPVVLQATEDTTEAPSPPQILPDSATEDSLTLTWVMPEGSADVARYQVYRDTTAIDSSARPADSLVYDTLRVNATDAEQTDTTLWTDPMADTSTVADTTYFYRVTAIDTAGRESGYSRQAPPSPKLASPTPKSRLSLLAQVTAWIGSLPWWGQAGGGVLLLLVFYGTVSALRGWKENGTSRQDETADRSSYEIGIPGGTLRIGNVQHVGGRSEQQDAFGFSDPSRSEVIEQKGLLAIVADGMGGMEKGAAASNAAIQAMIDAHEDWGEEADVSDWMRRAAGQANRAVLDVAEDAGLEGDVGTTLSAVLVRDHAAHWVNVGDSRVYLFRSDEQIQLTDDHVYARELQQQVRDGEISAEEAAHHPERGALTSYLGMPKLRHIDQSKRPLGLRDGDQILICSDGLYNGLEGEQMQAALALSPQEACKALVQQVLGDGGANQDNVTAIVLGYEQSDEHEQTGAHDDH